MVGYPARHDQQQSPHRVDASNEDTKHDVFKNKLFPLVAEPLWDTTKLMTPFGDQARLYSPKHLALRTARSEASMAKVVHSKVHKKFRNFCDSSMRTFSVRAPRPASPAPMRMPASPSLHQRARKTQLQPAAQPSNRPLAPLRFWSGVVPRHRWSRRRSRFQFGGPRCRPLVPPLGPSSVALGPDRLFHLRGAVDPLGVGADGVAPDGRPRNDRCPDLRQRGFRAEPCQHLSEPELAPASNLDAPEMAPRPFRHGAARWTTVGATSTDPKAQMLCPRMWLCRAHKSRPSRVHAISYWRYALPPRADVVVSPSDRCRMDTLVVAFSRRPTWANAESAGSGLQTELGVSGGQLWVGERHV